VNSFWSVTAFWGLAVLFVAVALAFVLPPLLRRKVREDAAGRRSINIAVYRDQLHEMESDRRNGLLSDEQFEVAKVELEARLAQDALGKDEDPALPQSKGGRWLGFALAGLIPILAFGGYLTLGNPEAILGGGARVAAPPGMHDIGAMVAKVEEKVKEHPDDGQAWFMLGRSYAAMERWPEAVQALEHATGLLPQESSVWSHYAEALAINAGRELEGKPMQMVDKALKLNPDDQKALELAGINAFQKHDFAAAVRYLEHLYGQLPPESQYARDIDNAIQDAKRQLGEVANAKLDQIMPEHPAVAAAGISGEVDIAPRLKGKVPANAVLFLFAKSLGGEGPPLAVVRGSTQSLPLSFDLTDAQAMTPQSRLSDHKEVMLMARVSMSGQPMASSGDLEGSLAKVKVGAKGVKLVIDSVHP
jgi:cytochrome c-type biogenesis protein CcmH